MTLRNTILLNINQFLLLASDISPYYLHGRTVSRHILFLIEEVPNKQSNMGQSFRHKQAEDMISATSWDYDAPKANRQM